MRKDAKQNKVKQSKMKQKFSLFVSQTEAKIMRNELHFASVSHEAKKKFKQIRDTLVAASACPIHPRINQLLEEFPELLRLSSVALAPKHGVFHHILMDGKPVFAKAHCLKLAKRCVAEEEFAALGALTWCPRKMDPGGHAVTTGSTPSSC
jgi:hypothetical protein